MAKSKRTYSHIVRVSIYTPSAQDSNRTEVVKELVDLLQQGGYEINSVEILSTISPSERS